MDVVHPGSALDAAEHRQERRPGLVEPVVVEGKACGHVVRGDVHEAGRRRLGEPHGTREVGRVLHAEPAPRGDQRGQGEGQGALCLLAELLDPTLQQLDRTLGDVTRGCRARLHQRDPGALQQHLGDQEVVVARIGQRGGQHLVEQSHPVAGELGDRQTQSDPLVGARQELVEGLRQRSLHQVDVVARRGGLHCDHEPLETLLGERDRGPVSGEQVELGSQLTTATRRGLPSGDGQLVGQPG